MGASPTCISWRASSAARSRAMPTTSCRRVSNHWLNYWPRSPPTAAAVSSIAAAAGFLYATKYITLQQPAHETWIRLGLKAFVAAVVGGIGNIRGAMLGGLLIGLIEFFGAAYLSPNLRDVYVFAVLILVLLFRPAGILGRATVEKV